MKKFLKINEIRNLLSMSRPIPRDHALFHIALCTGLRISDILNLKRDDMVDSDSQIVRQLRIKMQKTGAMVSRPLRDDCRIAIQDYLYSREDQNPFLFPAMKNQYEIRPFGAMCRLSAHRIYKQYLGGMYSSSELQGVSTHTLRRSMGKIISQAAGRIEPATKYLGHKSIASTQEYIDMDGYEEKANKIVGSLSL